MKKKILAFALCATTVLGLAACGKKDEVQTQTPVQEEEVVTPETETETEPEQVVETYGTAVDVLTVAHVEFDEETLSYLGGGFGEEVVQGAPSAFPIDDFETVRSMLTFPAEYIELVDEAGSIMHMMNGNLYTSAAFHVADNANMLLIEEAVLDTVKNNQWMCGFPEKLVVGQVENYVVYAYGNAELVDKFEAGLNATELAEVKFVEDLMVAEETVEEDAEAVEADGEAVAETNETADVVDTEVETTEETVEETETVEEVTEAVEAEDVVEETTVE